MHAIWVIFKKDARRLWWQIAVSLGLLAVLTWQDAWRSDVTPGLVEGWLNLLLPLAWACLVALAIYGEPLIGDREFWMTRPYRRHQLLAAKVLFVMMFVHAPAFLSDVAIVMARGFSPLASLPHLAAKQIVIACAVSLPAIALASMLGNLMPFLFVAVLAPVVAAMLANSFQDPFGRLNPQRLETVAVVLGAAALVMIYLQFSRRRTRISRLVGIGAALAAAAMYIFLSPGEIETLRADTASIHPSLYLDLTSEDIPMQRVLGQVNMMLPVELSGVPMGTYLTADSTELTVTSAGGARIHAYRFSPRAQYQTVDLYGGLYLRELNDGDSILPRPLFQLSLSRSAFASLKDRPVTISGTAALDLYQPQAPVRMPVGASRWFPGVGWCRSAVQDWLVTQGELKVECEAASGEAPFGYVQVDSLGELLREVRPGYSVPAEAWLSPVDRRQTSFFLLPPGERRLSPDDPHFMASRYWRLPRDVLATAEIVITPERPIGHTTIHYRFNDIDLKNYMR